MEFSIDKLAKEVAEKALDEITYEGKTIREWVEIIAKQQPCEDCISREAVLEFLKGFEILHNHDELRTNLIYGIMNLPSVTPSYNSVKTELKPREDCISREQAIRVAEQGQIQGYEWQFKKLCNLPSVTPQPKVGKWIKPNTEPWIKMGDGFTPYECSECEAVEFKKSKYCPNCGAKMEVEK